MKWTYLGAIGIVALASIALVALTYRLHFPGSVSPDPSIWGSFGDYFGGILNPLFAFLAFLGVLWSIEMQNQQLRDASIEKKSAEILLVIRDMDARIHTLLETEVGKTFDSVGATSLRIRHMVSEAGKKDRASGPSDSYFSFLSTARVEGSIVESSTRDLRHLVISMQELIALHPVGPRNELLPITKYYSNKTRPVAILINDIEALSGELKHFYSLK